jgi:hypothetical protein
MTSETQEDRNKPSSWTRLPDGDKAQRPGGPDTKLRAAIDEGAHEISGLLGRGLQRASDVLGSGAASELESLMGSTDLPELRGEDALGALALRLDRESDYWRALGLKGLARCAWADRAAYAASLLAALGCTCMAAVAAFDALFNGSGASRVLMVLAGCLALVAGAGTVGAMSSSVRRSQQQIARDAMARADLAELRLHRVGVVLALRGQEPSCAIEAIQRLEREIGAPVR